MANAQTGARERESYTTVFGSLSNYEKGSVELINDDARHYAFSNVYEVANKSKAWEQVAVAKNFEYVIEAIRAEGVSGWRTAAHDQFAVNMDTPTVVVELVKLDSMPVGPEHEGSVAVDGEPAGKRMGRMFLKRGHQALLPAGAAYRFTSEETSVLMVQTILGVDTKQRWAEICQTV